MQDEQSQPGLCQTWSETPKTVFSQQGSFYSRYVSNDAIEENPVHQSVTAEIKKYDELTVEKEEKPKPKPTRQKFKKASDVEIKLNTGMLKIIRN